MSPAEPILAPELAALTGIRHGFFTRRGGVSTGLYDSLNIGQGSSDDPGSVAENRGRVADALGIDRARLYSVYQVHSPDVVVVDGPWIDGVRPKADAMVTATPGLGLSVITADCGPLLFADAAAGVIGAAHAGWRGAFSGVIEATLKAMAGLGAHHEDIIAVLGPTISQSSYEVGPEFVARFTDDDSANERFFTPSERAGHALFDLPGYIGMRLERAGIRAADLGLCTYRDEARFFSFRRTSHRGEADFGRLASVIALVDDASQTG